MCPLENEPVKLNKENWGRETFPAATRKAKSYSVGKIVGTVLNDTLI
jgi:hypothetical protein